MNGRRLEHGTPEGYDRGCTRHDHCPALTVHGLTCYTAHVRFASSERRYMSGYDRRLPAAAIARMLGLAPLRPTSTLTDAEPVAIAGPAGDVEAQIEAYAIAKEARDRAAAAASAKTPGGGAAVDEDNLGATGAPARTAPGPTSDPTPAVCPECVAGKHGNCDGTAWDLTADQPTTCNCTHPENNPDNQEQIMPKKIEPTSTPAMKPQPPAKPIERSGRTKAERAEIRAWAEANGWTIGTTGRIPQAIIAAYDEAVAEGDITQAPSAEPAPSVPIPEPVTEVISEDEPVGEYDYAVASDKLDETRVRIEANPADVEAIANTLVAARIPESSLRPEWAEVTISRDVERARDLAVRLEGENAILVEQLDTMGTALEVALRSWAAADERIAAAARQRESLAIIRSAANRYLLERIHTLEGDLEAADNTITRLNAAAQDDDRRIAELVAEVDRLSARRWGRAFRPQRSARRSSRRGRPST